MVKTGISEFTFGFAFLHEQANTYAGDLIAAPILPSLIQEEEQGWDAKLPTIGGVYFYQFKLSDYLTRSNAKFIKDGTYSSPYYCFKLHKKNKNKQHNKLLELSLIHPNVYYVAPEFTGVEAFDDAFMNRRVSEKSRLIPLKGCGYISDSKQHHISYQTSSRTWAQHSQAKHHEISYRGNDIYSLYNAFETKRNIIDTKFIINLYESITYPLIYNKFEFEHQKLSEQEKRFLILDESNISWQSILKHTAKIVSVFYGASLIVIGERGINKVIE